MSTVGTVYCRSCGARLRETAKFCRTCGQAQGGVALPPPPTPVPFQSPPRPVPSRDSGLAAVALVGGLAICFFTLYGTIYLPLREDFPVNFGEPPRPADVIELMSGIVVIILALSVWVRPTRDARARGLWLAVAGVPPLFQALLWSVGLNARLPEAVIHIYARYIDFGWVELGDWIIPLPFILASTAVVLAGLLMRFQPAPMPAPRHG